MYGNFGYSEARGAFVEKIKNGFLVNLPNHGFQFDSPAKKDKEPVKFKPNENSSLVFCASIEEVGKTLTEFFEQEHEVTLRPINRARSVLNDASNVAIGA